MHYNVSRVSITQRIVHRLDTQKAMRTVGESTPSGQRLPAGLAFWPRTHPLLHGPPHPTPLALELGHRSHAASGECSLWKGLEPVGVEGEHQLRVVSGPCSWVGEDIIGRWE